MATGNRKNGYNLQMIRPHVQQYLAHSPAIGAGAAALRPGLVDIPETAMTLGREGETVNLRGGV